MEACLPTVNVFKLNHANLEKVVCTSVRHNFYESDFTQRTFQVYFADLRSSGQKKKKGLFF